MARLALIVPLTIGLIFVLLYTAFNSLTLRINKNTDSSRAFPADKIIT